MRSLTRLAGAVMATYGVFIVAGYVIYWDGLRKSPDYLAAIRMMWSD